jgi:hypothetical protein
VSGKGWLKNGNPAGDFRKAPRCGAKNRRGLACQQPGMTNGRCRLHGGKSTGARTPEGRQRIAQANLKHGYYAQAARQERRDFRALVKRLRQQVRELDVA